MTKRTAIGAAAFAAIVLVLTQVMSHRVPMGTVIYGVLYGGLEGLLAVGLILLYRVTKAINFAYGSMGGLAAAVGTSLYLGHHWPWGIDVVVALIVGGVVGLAVGALVNWRFARSSRLILTVATIGLAQLLSGVSAYVPQWLHGRVLVVTGFRTGLSKIHHEINPVYFTGNDLLVAIAVPVMVAAVTWYLLRTDSGRAVRAIADNSDRARLLGIPARRLLLAVWALSGVIAAMSVMLAAPSQGVVVGAGPSLLLAPLAAAVMARMESFTTAFLASIGLGVVGSLVGLNVSKQAVTSVVLLAIIVVALLLQHRTEDRAGSADGSSWSAAGISAPIPAALRALPEVRWAKRTGLVALAGGALILPAILTPGRMDQVSVALVFGMVALSLVVMSGWGGIVSLGQVAITGVGAIAAGDLMMHVDSDMFLALLAGGVAGAAIAVVLGLPALRVKGLYLAVTTLAFALAAEQFFFNPTNFSTLMPSSVLRPVLWKRFKLEGEGDLYLVCLGMLILTVVALLGIRRSRSGRAVLAARDNMRGAEAAAVPTTRVRLTAFMISGLIAGVAGGLYVVILGEAGQGTFPSNDSLVIFSTTVIGGIGSIPGALTAVGLIQWLGIAFPKLQILLTGVGVLVVLAFFPAGLAGLGQRVRERVLVAIGRRHGIETSVWGDAPTAPPVPVAAGSGTALLRCRGVDAAYGSLQVLFGVDFEVEEGQIVALLGTNGAGKSSLLRSITGLLPARAGTVEFAGADMTSHATERIARSGVTMMPGGRGIFGSLTVAENLRVASWPLRHDPKEAARARVGAHELFPILAERSGSLAGNLSGGEQQMLSLAMALLTRPRLLCIDELSLGLAPAVVSTLIEAVRRIRDLGTTVVVVEQSVTVALLVAERAVFLERGQVRFTGATEDLLDRPDLLRAVFLGSAPEVAIPETTSSGPPVLECSGLVKRFGGITAVNSVNLTVHAGEVVGLIGHNGAGKTTLFDLLSGFSRPDDGRILLGGVDVTGAPSYRRAIGGLGRSFQEARLFPSLTVAETIKVAMERHLANRDPLAAALNAPAATDSEARADEEVDRIVDLLGLAEYRDRPAADLSTGTRRIVELACVLAHRPSVLLLDEPTGGVAQAETQSLPPLLRKVAAETGCAMVVIEHDMALITSLSDRLVALELGAVIAEGPPSDVLSHPDVIASYLGAEMPAAKPPRRRRRVAAAGSSAITSVAVLDRESAPLPPPPPPAAPLPPPVSGNRLERFRVGLGPAGWLPLLLLAGLAAVQGFDSTAFGVLSPEIRHTFHLNDAGINSVAGLTAAIPLLLSVKFGNLGDRGDRIRLSRRSALVWGVTAVFTGAAPVLVVLILARLAGGIGLLATQTIYPSLLSDYYPPDSQAGVFTAYLLGSTGIGLLSSPLVGGVGSLIGWRPAFIVLAVPTFVLVYWLQSMHDPGHRTDSAAEPKTTAPAIGVWPAFRRIRAIRTLRRTWGGAFFIGAGVVPIATVISTFLNDVYRVGPTERGVVVALVGIGALIGLVLAGVVGQRLADEGRASSLPLVTGGAAAILAVFAAMSGLLPSLWLSVAAIVVAGFGVGGFLPAYVTTVTLVTPSELRSQAYAWSLVFYATGAIIVSGLVGAIADSAGRRAELVVLGLCVLVGAVVVLTSTRFCAADMAAQTPTPLGLEEEVSV